MPAITVEFFSTPRHRAGRTELTVSAATIAEALAAVESACPGLSGLVHPDGRLAAHYLLSLNGGRFLTDLRQPLEAGARLWLLSADAGG